MRLTVLQRQALRCWKRALMARVNARRRGKAVKSVPWRKPVWSKSLVRLIAHLSFDGRVDRHGCHYYSRSRVQAEHVKRLLCEVLGIDPQMRLRPNGMWVVSRYNVELAAWLSGKECALLRVVGARATWRQQWLQAFFDDEGCVTLTKKKRLIRGYQHSLSILELIKELLAGLKIESRIDSKYGELSISRKDNLLKFQKLINFTPGLRVNGSRSNSIWKKSLEKREILRMALASYLS